MSAYLVYPGTSGGGGSGGGALAANVVNIGSGVQTLNVLYSGTLAAPSVPVFSIINTVDASPIFLIGFISAFSTTGFTVKFNAPTDTANYQLSYIVVGVA